MAKLDATIESRIRYGKWIKEIREKKKMSQEEFGTKILRFENQKGEEICVSYHRNSVGNWEQGNNLPVSMETFVSLALLEFCGHTHQEELSLEERQMRLVYVQSQMEFYLKKRLYCRNINDALLIQAVRGIYSLNELPQIRKDINAMLSKVMLSQQEKETFSLESATMSLAGYLYKTNTREEFEELVDVWKVYFYLGGRTVGERMRHMYETSGHYPGDISFKKAVRIYAPRYHDSYNRIFSSDICVSRRWLLELCICLRFTRADINQILTNASMVSLSEERDSPEYYIRQGGNVSVGSVVWYQSIMKTGIPEFRYRYLAAKNISLQDKLAYATLIACYMAWVQELDSIPPVDYFLDYFFSIDEGLGVLRRMRKKARENPEKAQENTQEMFNEFIISLEEIIRSVPEEVSLGTKREIEVYHLYREEFSRYYHFPKHKSNSIKNKDVGERLLFFTAFTYSLFTGKIFDGNLYQEDLEELKKELFCGGRKMDGVYPFLNTIWIVFLDKEPIYEQADKKIYGMRSNNTRKTKAVDMEEILEDISTSWILSEECIK